MKWLELVKALAPIILAAVPNQHVQTLGPVIVGGITEAESMHGASSAEKRAHVLRLAHFGAEGVNAAAGKDMIPAGTEAAVGKAIDAIVDAANLVHARTS